VIGLLATRLAVLSGRGHRTSPGRGVPPQPHANRRLTDLRGGGRAQQPLAP
jgi:hypothetical protein